MPKQEKQEMGDRSFVDNLKYADKEETSTNVQIARTVIINAGLWGVICVIGMVSFILCTHPCRACIGKVVVVG